MDVLGRMSELPLGLVAALPEVLPSLVVDWHHHPGLD